MANHRAEAGADDRIPPSQECSPHPGRKTTQKQTRQPQKNRPKMVNRMANQTCTESQKVSRTQRQPGIDQANKQYKLEKLPAIREKAEIPISVVKLVRRPLSWTGNRLPVTKRHKTPLSLAITSQYSTNHRASIRMPIITQALYCLAFIILQC